MEFKLLNPPTSGTRITREGDRLVVPDDPIIPFIEGDGIGPDIWAASQPVFDAAVEKAYGGKKKIHWFEIFAGAKANQRFDQWLRSRRAPEPHGYHLPLKPFWAVGSFLGSCAFMLGVTIYLIASDGVPSTVPAGQILASGLVLTGLFAAFAAAMIWRGLAHDTRSEPAKARPASA